MNKLTPGNVVVVFDGMRLWWGTIVRPFGTNRVYIQRNWVEELEPTDFVRVLGEPTPKNMARAEKICEKSAVAYAKVVDAKREARKVATALFNRL